MSFINSLKSLNSKAANNAGFRSSSLALLAGSSALAVAGVLAFLFAVPQAVSAQEALKAQSESTIVDAQGQNLMGVTQSKGVASDAMDSANVEGATDAITSGSAQQAETQDGTSTTNNGGAYDFGAFVPITGGNVPDANDGSADGASGGQGGNGQPTSVKKPSASPSSKSSKKSNGGPVSNNSDTAKSTSSPDVSNSGTSTSSDSNEYAAERSKLKSAFNELTSQLSSLSNAVSNSYTMDPTHNSKTPCSSGTSRIVIATANNAISAASGFSSRYSAPKKFADLASCYTEMANAYKYISSAASLAKTYHEKLIACPNPRTHSACFTDCVKGHRILKRGSSGSVQYDMDHLANAESLVSRIREANIL